LQKDVILSSDKKLSGTTILFREHQRKSVLATSKSEKQMIELLNTETINTSVPSKGLMNQNRDNHIQFLNQRRALK
jgi:hypothetical protein